MSVDPNEKMTIFLTGMSTAERTRRKEKAIKFPMKLMYSLHCPEYQHVISWNPTGLSFSIIDPSEFEKKVLPDLFKVAKFTSFQRKLNRWGFVKHRAASIDIFSHGKFIRGDVALCCTMTCSGPDRQDPDGNEDLMVLRHALHSNKRQQLSLPYQNVDNMNFMEGSLGSSPPDHRRSIGLNMGSALDSSITPLAPPLAVINQRLPSYSSQASREGPLFANNIRPSMMLNESRIVDTSSHHHSPLMSSNALQFSNRQAILGNESDLLSYEEALFLENIKNRQLMQLSIQQQQQTQQQAYQMTNPTLAEMTRSPMNADLSRFDSLLQQEREYDIQRQTNLMANPLHPKQHQSCFADSGRAHQRRRFHY